MRLCIGLAVLVAALSLVIAPSGGRTEARDLKKSSASLFEADRLARDARSMLANDPARAAKVAAVSGRVAETSAPGTPGRAIAIATSQWLRGEAALRLNHDEAAKPLIDGALATVFHNAPNSSLQADILVSRARLESSEGRVQASLPDYLSAFDIYKRVHDAKHQAVTLQDIGLLYHDAGDYEKALYYYGLSHETFSGEPVLDLSVSNNRADSLDELGRFKEAEGAYARALKVADSIRSPSLQVQVLNNLALAQIKSGRFAAARLSLDRGLRIARADSAGDWLLTLLSTSAQLDMKQGRLAAARAIIDLIVSRNDLNLDTERDQSLHRVAYEVYKSQGLSDLALAQLEIYQTLQREQQTLMASANTALMAARFDFDNQNARIAALRAGELRRDIAVTRLRAHQNQILLGSLLVFVCGLALFLGLHLRTLRRSRDTTREINTRLEKSNGDLENALQARSQFLATTSHEIRTPLNGVLGMTEVLLADKTLSERVRQRVRLIHGAGKSMRVLIDDLLDLSKMDAGQVVTNRDVVDLPTLLWEVHRFWASHAESAGLTLTLDLNGSPLLINEDARRLRQILSNLLSNAIKFTPAGSIALIVETRASAETGDLLLLHVVDTGIGVPETDRAKIFEKFTQLDAGITRKYGGTGLGLAIAQSLARTMGGDVIVTANPAGGSIFTLSLPLERIVVEQNPTAVRKRSTPQSLIEMDVLMIESNPIRQAALRAILESHVAAMTFQSTALEGIASIEARFVDVVIAPMPVGDAGAGDTDDLPALADLVGVLGGRLVIILDRAGDATGEWAASQSVSLLERPVSASKLIDHLETLAKPSRLMEAMPG